MEGLWQETFGGSRFTYGTVHYYGEKGEAYKINDVKYDKFAQILSGKFILSLSQDNITSIESGNHNGFTITADFKIYLPAECFQLTKRNMDTGTFIVVRIELI